MKIAATAILCFLMITAAQAFLRGSPEIMSAAIDERDPDIICISLQYVPFKTAISTNGGVSFQKIDDNNIPANLTPDMTLGARWYVLADSHHLLRSDDGGVTWTNTAATSFLQKISNTEMEAEKKWFWEEFGSRLPQRSAFWNMLFGVFAIAYGVFTFCALRTQGSFGAILTILRGVFVILLVWCLLWGFHSVILNWTETQYPYAYWNTSAATRPSAKLGLVMAIAARPLPLLAYLIALWPILPGSINVILGPQPTTRRRKYISIMTITIGTLFVLFHLCMMFVGYFFV